MASAPPRFPPPGTLKAKVTNRLIGLNTVAYRVSGGRIGGKMSGGDAPESERDRLWAIALENYPYFDEYQTRTTRRIPVLVLSPV